MNKVKITVLETTLNTALVSEYGVAGLGVCPFLKEGDVYYADYAKPDGFCDEAWKSIHQFVFALAHGVGKDGSLLYHGEWVSKPGVSINTCSDGLRPVVFKLETTDLESVV
ncbi:MAG: TIGR04076 family protein [Clostridiales bacterium]|jgi:uncharacterized repeat protein (TIGR04076 family)|nr:TIGR04076 family protein [Clostridiales bacterium]MDR2749061.1 TIGR04076 family protein [Clostridiales bacterium]